MTFTFKRTTKGHMTFISVKAFGFFLNASYGKAAKKAAPKANPNAWLGGWTLEGYGRFMDTMTMKALDEVVSWVHKDLEWELYEERVNAKWDLFLGADA